MTKQENRESDVLFDAARAANFALNYIKEKHGIVKTEDWICSEFANLDQAITAVDNFYMNEYQDPDPEESDKKTDGTVSSDDIEFLCKVLANTYSLAEETAVLAEEGFTELRKFNPDYESKKMPNYAIIIESVGDYVGLRERGLDKKINKYFKEKASALLF